MTISIWRYSHLTLAISSSIFILIAAITGVVLAFEPISNQLKPYAIENASQISLAKTIDALQDEYKEVVSLEVDANNFVSASIITKEGKSETFYINPFTGKKIGDIIEKASIYKFATNLHRSLFLKSTGRFIIGFVSFLLLLMAVTGVLLITKRQGGFKRFFSKIVKENFEQYYHIILGRYMLIPIIIVTVTGVYLSLEKFSLLPSHHISHTTNETLNTETTKTDVSEFSLLKNTLLEAVKSVEFPFSDDVEDYFFLKLKDKELLVNQYSGNVVSEQKLPLVALVSNWSLLLHTGEGTIVWSLVLFLACCAILFFIYSGFVMTLKRKKNSLIPKNKFSKDNAKYIILVGSETGSSYGFATAFYKALIARGQSVYISELNAYNNYEKATNIIVFTATYGEGEAPTNANNFEKLLHKIHQKNSLNYSVVGFGSLAYPDFCKYAIVVDAMLQMQLEFNPNAPLCKINNQSFKTFKNWTQQWSESVGLNLNIEQPVKKDNSKETKFTVINKTTLNKDDSFLVRLKPKKKVKFSSGDLLSIYPENDTVERLYSIGKIDDNMVLSIKKHEFGVCSNYFNLLKENDIVTASIKPNKTFHFPTNEKEVVLIANGTGIAPFLGMINENNMKTHLFWGGRTQESLKMYSKYIDKAFYNKRLSGLYISFSNEERQKKYVQNSISEKTDLICRVLNNDGTIMICGSVAMLKGVLKTLNDITVSMLNEPISTFESNNQIKTDCY